MHGYNIISVAQNLIYTLIQQSFPEYPKDTKLRKTHTLHSKILQFDGEDIYIHEDKSKYWKEI